MGSIAGCRPAAESATATAGPTKPITSDVPLRIWVASPISDPSIVKRQWLADSDQELEVTQVDVGELLTESLPECDVVLFPARLLGQLIRQGSILKLPASVIADSRSLDAAAAAGVGDETLQEDPGATLRTAERAQILYDGEPFAMPLGCTVPVVIASTAAADRFPTAMRWAEVVQELEQTENFNGLDEARLDANAVVDRFLCIAGSISTRNPKYGLLFEMQTMQPRLREAEFREAARILFALSRQPDAASSALGSHASAFAWVAHNPQAVVAIVAPGLMQFDSDEEPADEPVASQDASGIIVDVVSEGDIAGWNTGGGLVAALSANCRQTAQSNAFIQWLREERTRAAIAPFILGVDSSASGANTDPLSQMVVQKSMKSLDSGFLPQEPSLPQTENYRAALSRELIAFLLGEKTVEQALEDAQKAWVEITAQQGIQQRSDYEKSLGLTL